MANFKWNQPALNNLQRGITKGLLNIAATIARKARTNAPVKTGALRRSIRVGSPTDKGMSVRVLAGGQSPDGRRIDYALMREFNNKLHPGTKYYMTNAVKEVAKSDIKQYFKEIR